MTNGWKLSQACREALIAVHPARYENIVADHVTLNVGSDQIPFPVCDARIIGRADDGSGVEAMVVEIAGSTARPDGKIWHITWSLAEGRAARESNEVIAELGWKSVEPAEVDLIASCW